MYDVLTEEGMEKFLKSKGTLIHEEKQDEQGDPLHEMRFESKDDSQFKSIAKSKHSAMKAIFKSFFSVIKE